MSFTFRTVAGRRGLAPPPPKEPAGAAPRLQRLADRPAAPADRWSTWSSPSG